MLKPLALSQVITYRNDDVVGRFCDDHGVDFAAASEVFVETLKWLWLCAHQSYLQESKGKAPVGVPLLSEIFVIDLMWHNFILFTEEYQNFCNDYLKSFVHHVPQTRRDRERFAAELHENPDGAKAEKEAALRNACELIYDELGAETLSKWVEDFPARFSKLN